MTIKTLPSEDAAELMLEHYLRESKADDCLTWAAGAASAYHGGPTPLDTYLGEVRHPQDAWRHLRELLDREGVDTLRGLLWRDWERLDRPRVGAIAFQPGRKWPVKVGVWAYRNGEILPHVWADGGVAVQQARDFAAYVPRTSAGL